MTNVVNKLFSLVDGLFHKENVKAEEPETHIIDEVKDKNLAKDILTVEILGCALRVIENEVDAEFEVKASEALSKYYGLANVVDKLVEQIKFKAKVDKKGVVSWSKEEQCRMEADEFKDSAKKMIEEIKSFRHLPNVEYEGKEIKTVDTDGNETTAHEYIGPDFPGCAQLLSKILDRKTRGDFKVNLTEERIAKELFFGNKEKMHSTERLGDLIFNKTLTDNGAVLYRYNPMSDDSKVGEFQRTILQVGATAIEMFGGLDKKVIPFPATEAERERYLH